MVASLRYILPFLLLAACAGRSPGASTLVSTAERDAPLQSTEGAIGGMVLDSEEGLPLSMVILQAELDGRVVAEDVSDYHGKYRVGPLPPGNYRVSARFANARVVYDDIVVLPENETEVRVKFDLRAQGDDPTANQSDGTTTAAGDSSTTAAGDGSTTAAGDGSATVQSKGGFGTIKGIVLDGVDGVAFPGTVVALQGHHLSEAVMAMADAEGQFRFRSLRPGTYSLICYYQLVEQGNIEIRRGNVVVVPGETTDVQLELDLTIR
jgi:hypothetical protein